MQLIYFLTRRIFSSFIEKQINLPICRCVWFIFSGQSARAVVVVPPCTCTLDVMLTACPIMPAVNSSSQVIHDCPETVGLCSNTYCVCWRDLCKIHTFLWLSSINRPIYAQHKDRSSNVQNVTKVRAYTDVYKATQLCITLLAPTYKTTLRVMKKYT